MPSLFDYNRAINSKLGANFDIIIENKRLRNGGTDKNDESDNSRKKGFTTIMAESDICCEGGHLLYWGEGHPN